MPSAGDKILAADTDDLGDYTIRRPLVRLIAQSTQNLTNNTATAITFGASSEDIDTHGFHDTASNTSRITPSVAGYYQVRGVVFFGSRADYTILEAWIAKNGSNVASAERRVPPLITGAQDCAASAIVSCNGTTDYVEVIGLHVNGATATQATAASGRQTSTLEAIFLRPL